MAEMAVFLKHILYQNPSSLYMKVVEIASLPLNLNAAYSEVSGNNLKYSKFSPETEKNKLRSKYGMFVCYGPALLVSSACLFLAKAHSARWQGLAAALSLHFFKRELEVLFVHKYSGFMPLRESLVISTSYFMSSVNLLYAQHLSETMAPPQMDLRLLGFALYLVGLAGNFYHHWLLSGLRKEGQSKKYVVPEGGLFGLVVCPHYLFEVIEWFGVACICQTVYGFIAAVGTLLYLSGRSISTKRWYLSKFDEFPKHRKAIFPFLL